MSPAPDGCARGLVLCGGHCIDPLTSQQYCGASGDCAGDHAGRPCTGSDACQGGTCQFNPPPRSYIFPGATAPGGTFPRPPNLAIAAPLPGTIYYTLDGTAPMRGAPNTMSGPTPLTLTAVPNNTHLRWFADYGGTIGREFETQGYDVEVLDNPDSEALTYGILGDPAVLTPSIADGVDPGPLTLVEGGTEVSVALRYQAWRSGTRGYCPGCILVLRIGVEGMTSSHCEVFGGGIYPGDEDQTQMFTVTAPTMPGRYLVRLEYLLQFNCPRPAGPVGGGTIVGQIMVH